MSEKTYRVTYEDGSDPIEVTRELLDHALAQRKEIYLKQEDFQTLDHVFHQARDARGLFKMSELFLDRVHASSILQPEILLLRPLIVRMLR